eukprot:TRINITY_DN5941_c0_g1_i1.p1 TRINITY_DN5941_c0_g1~~TRINITY_DN5941_c0_g1_i1.p1  ORF type:complete len:495 (+),score=225.05 TRINITY_DN5941_c0_g1_i1:211-1695(+)
MPTTSGEYTMRAQPRRRKESASRGDEPVFLRKTYDMINSCDQTLAGWSAKGDTFVIKDPDRFAAEVIPTFFKHSKFSSFVRQLNFYGFRKVKALDGRDAGAAAAAGWWEFKHDLFTRATPHLIAEIKRATHYVAPPEAEVDALRTEVTTLTARMLAMDARIAALSALVDELRAQPPAAAAAPAAAVPSKRRRVDGDASAAAAAEEMAAAFGGGGAMDAMLPPLPQTPGVKPELLFDVAAEPVADEAELLRTMSLASVDTNASFFDPDLFDSFGLAGGSGGAGGLEFMAFDTVDQSMPPVSAAFDGMVDAGGSAQQEAAVTLLSAPTTQPAPAWELGDGATTAAATAEENATPALAPAATDTSAPAAAVAEAAEQAADLAQSLSALPGDAQAKLAEGVLALLRHQSAAAGSGAASDAAAPALSKATAAAAMAPPAAAPLLPGAPEIAMPLASAALGAFLTHFAHRRGGMQGSLVRTLSTQSAASVAAPLLHAPVV